MSIEKLSLLVFCLFLLITFVVSEDPLQIDEVSQIRTSSADTIADGANYVQESTLDNLRG